jgi:hypothetical protein
MEIFSPQRRLLQLISHARQNRRDLFNLLSMAQTPRNDKFLVRCVAQSLSEPVETIFSDLALLVAVTEPSRRQVWFAALALLETDGRLVWFKDQVKRDELIAVMLSASNERILKMVRSEAPPRHYLSAITRLGNSARSAQTYALLWTLMRNYPGAAKSLAQRVHAGTMCDTTLFILASLVPSSDAGVRDALRVAERFSDRPSFERWKRLYETLKQRRGLDEPDIRALARGIAPEAITNALLKQIAFPAPVLGEPFLYASNWVSLTNLAEHYQNCLRGRGWIDRARNGQIQVYELKDSATDVVLALIRDVTGWRLSEAKLAGNRPLPRMLRERLAQLLSQQGIYTGSCPDVEFN